jgi:hypothetical protein
MTEHPPRPRIRKPSPLPVVAGALALFLVVFNLLVFQMRADSQATAVASARPAAAAPPRRVIHRRVIVTKVIVRVRRDEGDDGSAPVTRVSQTVPAPARPAPAPAAPAAPAPAPLTTRTS